SPETDRLIIVTGTREKNLEARESATPVQIVSSTGLLNTGRPGLSGVLAQLVLSFVAQGFGPDMSNLTLQTRLRGLSPNDTLTLVNGKRRHTSANLAVDTGSPYTAGRARRSQLHPDERRRSHRGTDGRRGHAVRLGFDRGRHQHHSQAQLRGRHRRWDLKRILRRRRYDEQRARRGGISAGPEFLRERDRAGLQPRSQQSRQHRPARGGSHLDRRRRRRHLSEYEHAAGTRLSVAEHVAKRCRGALQARGP